MKMHESRDNSDVAFVIVYDTENDRANTPNRYRRRSFERNLVKNGVRLSKVYGIKDPALCFVKLILPWETMLTYADLMKMKMPLKSLVIQNPTSTFKFIMDYLPSMFELPVHHLFEENTEHLSVFRKDKLNMFNVRSEDTFFSVSQKGLIAYEILSRTSWSNAPGNVGIQKLIGEKVYIAAYPLHEGKYKSDLENIEELTHRQILYRYWAQVRQMAKYQPIPLIRHYFGERVAIYFAWLGFYTIFLVPPTILGLIGFIYSVSRFGQDDVSLDVCNSNMSGSLIMCPLCDEVCDYWNLSESCLSVKIANVFDNDFTILYSILMSLWGSIFLHFWIRKESELQFTWSTSDVEEEESLRQDYESGCKHQKLNHISNELEWYMTTEERFPRLMLSSLSVVIMVGFIVSIIISGILIRIALTKALYQNSEPLRNSSISLNTAMIAAFFNLTAILILNAIYHFVALWLTEQENPRTQTEYDDSFTLKMFSFQFLNFYSPLFYIAFFKGTFIGRPGQYKYTFGWRQEECDTGGCMMELCIQMTVVYIGKQLVNNLIEFCVPICMSQYKSTFYHIKHRKINKTEIKRTNTPSSSSEIGDRNESKTMPVEQWEKDFNLVDSDSLDLFDEYLEMVVQFGFVTLFAAAMPLTPLFALVNNVFEIRFDAYKMLTKFRRPLARQAQDIGAWYYIMKALSALAVSTNAFIICFTSSAIPKMVYRFYYNTKYWDLRGYIDFSLATFNIKDFEIQNIPAVISDHFKNITECRYRDFRNGPDLTDKYNFSTAFWHVLAARLAFVIIFEHLVFIIVMFICWIIPETPSSVKLRKDQETQLNNKLLFRFNTTHIFGTVSEHTLSRRSTSLLNEMNNQLNQNNCTPAHGNTDPSVDEHIL